MLRRNDSSSSMRGTSGPKALISNPIVALDMPILRQCATSFRSSTSGPKHCGDWPLPIMAEAGPMPLTLWYAFTFFTRR